MSISGLTYGYEAKVKAEKAAKGNTLNPLVGWSRNCPECKNWWYDRMRYGCRLDENRQTNTTAQLGGVWSAGPCKDFRLKRLLTIPDLSLREKVSAN